MLASAKFVIVKLPVAVAQVGCVTVPVVGAAGAPGFAVIVTDLAGEIHPALLLAVTLYVPTDKLLNVPLAWYAPPMLNVMPEPVGPVTVIIPVGTVHVGCVTSAVGVVGGCGCGLIVTEIELAQTIGFVLMLDTVIVCDPALTPEKVLLV